MKKITQELRAMDMHRLVIKIDEMRRELLKLRLQASTAHSKSFASAKKQLAKDIARALTIVQEKSALSKSAQV